MKKVKLLFLMSVCLMLSLGLFAQKVHTLGDSTMANYDENATVTRGWGMYFGNFLTNGWTSVNYAKGGRDSRAGYEELWQAAKKNVKAGDYVIITFGHNDEKNSGMDGYALKAYYESIGNTAAAAAVDLRGTVPSITYKECLGKIVDEVKALGAIPVICSPVCRSYFTGSTIRRNGRHDLGDSYKVLTADGPKDGAKLAADNHTMDYAYHSQQLASEKGAAFIDLTNATKTLYESYGDSKCHEYLFDGDGSTHFNTTGALLVARLCAQMMKEQQLLTDGIVLPSDISVSPKTGDFGEAYRGQTLTKEFTLSGFGLTPESGTVTITATNGVMLSTDKAEWASTLDVSYNASTLVQTFHAQLVLENSGQTNATITITQGDKKLEIPVTATAVTLEGGTDVKLYWRLEKDAECALTGPATVIGESWHGMLLQRYANPNAKTVWPDGTGYDASRKMQRNLVDNPVDKNGKTVYRWPADEIDDNPDRYIQFGVKANKGSELKVNNISLFLCGAGGNGMCAHVYYSTDNFETRATLFEGKKMTANNPVLISATPVVSLMEGKELLVRIYPWYDGTADDKTLCISDVTIGGMAVDTSSGITEVADGNKPMATAYYSVDGKQTDFLCRGLNIVRTIMSDGSVVTKKVIY